MPSWPFIRPLWKTGGKSLHALVGSAASGGEINFNIILSTLWWDEKAFLYKVIFKFALMYRNNIGFYPFFAIEWTAEWTDKNSHRCISSTILHLSAQKMNSKLQVSFWWPFSLFRHITYPQCDRRFMCCWVWKWSRLQGNVTEKRATCSPFLLYINNSRKLFGTSRGKNL